MINFNDFNYIKLLNLLFSKELTPIIYIKYLIFSFALFNNAI